LKSDDALKAASAFGGGIGRMGSACGALIGGTMAFSLLYGRSHEDRQEGYRSGRPKSGEKLAVLNTKLAGKFKEEYGSFLCDDIEK
jgi:C_GCAxxG_C_C family probable redox protein